MIQAMSIPSTISGEPQGLGYNVGEAKKRLGEMPVNSWDIIFKPELAAKFKDCGIHVLDAPTEIIPTALMYLGKDPNSHDKADLKAAQELLAKGSSERAEIP